MEESHTINICQNVTVYDFIVVLVPVPSCFGPLSSRRWGLYYSAPAGLVLRLEFWTI